jgi:hypothetical protein
MAITKGPPKVQVEILVDGTALPEYDDSNQEQAMTGPITKYVEARSGADFAIRYRLYEKPSCGVKIKVFLDGIYIMNWGRPVETFYDTWLQETLYGVQSNDDGTWKLSKFAFSDLDTGTYT